MKIGIVGARKYQGRQSVLDLIMSLPAEETIITSSCKGVCTWVKEAAEGRGMKVIVFSPDLSNIRAWFDIPKRYYQRNKEMVEACDLLYAFISAEDGFVGGTRFEVEYAVSLGIPAQVHWENGLSEWTFQYSFPFLHEKRDYFLAWEGFFQRIFLDLGRSPSRAQFTPFKSNLPLKPLKYWNNNGSYISISGSKHLNRPLQLVLRASP